MNSSGSNNGSSHHQGWQDSRLILEGFYFVILALFIIVINSWVILAVYRKRFLRKAENYLLVSLAFSDLCTGLLCLPLAFLCTMAPVEDCFYCYVSFATTQLLSISTILHILAVASERYVLIVLPFNHQRLRAKDVGVKPVLVILWTVSIGVAAVPFSWANIKNCLEPEESKPWIIYTWTCLVVFFVLPSLVLVYVFCCIFVVARDQIRKQEASVIPRTDEEERHRSTTRKEARAAVIFLVMWLVFVVCWSPFFALRIMNELGTILDLPYWLWTAFNVMRFLTSLLNPLLYSFLKEDFHQALKLDRVINKASLAHFCCYQRSSGHLVDTQNDNTPQRFSLLGTQSILTQQSAV